MAIGKAPDHLTDECVGIVLDVTHVGLDLLAAVELDEPPEFGHAA